jgi:hypothetical protein
MTPRRASLSPNFSDLIAGGAGGDDSMTQWRDEPESHPILLSLPVGSDAQNIMAILNFSIPPFTTPFQVLRHYVTCMIWKRACVLHKCKATR